MAVIAIWDLGASIWDGGASIWLESRKTAQVAQERVAALVLELDMDYCNNTFGTVPCGATGTKCYNTYGTCKDKTNFAKGTKTFKFCQRGMSVPPGETFRPYIAAYSFTPTEIPDSGGLAMRSQISLTLADEVCSDIEADKYAATRTAAGTFWTRFLARNYNAQGRIARVRKGFMSTPFDWGIFQTELYIIESIKGPDSNGNVNVVLSDITKGLDKNQLPLSCDGKLTADIKAVEHTAFAVAGAATNITLAATASPIDGAYNGMECYIKQNTGTGQRKVITAYVGATRVATVAAWAVVPDSTSVYEIGALNINVGSGKSIKYDDPVATGLRQFVRIGDEVIEYTARVGDVLSWPNTSYRAQFGTVRADHKLDDGVQLCFAPISKSVTDVIHRLINAAGIADGFIDLAGLAQEDTNWLGTMAQITACISVPEKASTLLNEVLIATNLSAWWDVVAQKISFKANMPQLSSAVVAITPNETISKSLQIERLDNLRITSFALSYALYSATANISEQKNFAQTDIYADAAAASANEYNGNVAAQIYSRWLGTGNQLHARSLVARRMSRLRNAPIKMKFKLDPRNEVSLGQLIDVTTRKLTDASGTPAVTRMRVTKILDDVNFDVETTSTTFFKRYAFIAPNGYPDYAAASTAQRDYAFIAANTGLMSDGSGTYFII